jgi:nitrate/TMAO reductase-like tetraheme cytochrome c subunit
MHAKSFSNPVFQAQYFRELLPQLPQHQNLRKDADRCIACHDPVAFIKNGGHITSPQQTIRNLSGIVCDFCHRISAYRGERPGGGNFVATPGESKFGPLKHASSRHHAYHELQTKSEFCGICHNDVNHEGVEIKSTFTEWKESAYARRKINCQDCHMNLQGFLTDNKPVYDSGQAATMTLGPNYKRNKLYTHKFPGAHAKTQTADALTLGLNVDKAEVFAGEEIELNVHVFNKKVGHSMPSGSADLRMLWLELVANVDGKMIAIPASPGQDAYDVAGKGSFDKEIIAGDIPEGSRMYRSIYLDRNGKQTLASYNATRIAFDNRLKAEELRKERYQFRIPKDTKGKVTFTARINYLRYPSSFARSLGIEKTEPVELAATIKEVKVR